MAIDVTLLGGQKIAEAFFGNSVEVSSFEKFGSGNINKTYLFKFSRHPQGHTELIGQIQNPAVFKDAGAVNHNIEVVGDFILKSKISEQEELDLFGMISRPLTLVKNQVNATMTTINGLPYRFFPYISGEVVNSVDDIVVPGNPSLELKRKKECLQDRGTAFGMFGLGVAGIPSEALKVTIPGFHDTLGYFCSFLEAIKNPENAERVREASAEIEKIIEYGKDLGVLQGLLMTGSLKPGTLHLDTKINNVIIDEKDGVKKGTVIDLDTVMNLPNVPKAFDAADAIRSLEDENRTDANIRFNEEMAEALLRGYGAPASRFYTANDIATLPLAMKIITVELATRFLTDYVEGDVYFTIDPARPKHNLERARAELMIANTMSDDRNMEIVYDAFGRHTGSKGSDYARLFYDLRSEGRSAANKMMVKK